METSEMTRALAMLKLALPWRAPEITDKTAVLWCSQLRGFTDDQIKASFHHAVNSLEVFPSIAQITRYCQAVFLSDDELAEQIAGRIEYCLQKFGSSGCFAGGSNHDAREKARQARTYIGELGWGVISALGGWDSLIRLSPNERVVSYKRTKTLLHIEVKQQNNQVSRARLVELQKKSQPVELPDGVDLTVADPVSDFEKKKSGLKFKQGLVATLKASLD